MESYVEERCIGRGSYGCAYLVHEVQTGAKYVVKKIPVELMTEKEKQQAFAEVDLLAQLQSPFVVQYKENFIEGTVLHIVMEYCDGGDLAGCIKAQDSENYFDMNCVLDWFVQMACAIKYLHRQRILHRDLKTSNIFLTKENIVKLGDFGIARTLNSTMDQAKTVVGTPYYMSPEVCESKPYSYASDIWSLGCVLYEI
ncbi:serine/threonine protein kinase, partial [Thraustotheca clavata]